mmetsp:Transcript_22860/g.79825  ORF Transcript_22860/g.79825 Transcript_22860/m.79825 type:complete len:107 (-) Transcript_22860:119-439(-)
MPLPHVTTRPLTNRMRIFQYAYAAPSHWTMAVTSGTAVADGEPAPRDCVPPDDFVSVPGMVLINGAIHRACNGACSGGADVIVSGQQYELVAHDTGLAEACDDVVA